MITSVVLSQNAVIPGTVRIDASFENVSVHYEIAGDDNRNSQLTISYKLPTSGNYQKGAMTMRAYPGLVVDRKSTSRNFHAGSVLFLESGRTYELECVLTDVDGGSLTTTHSVTTKRLPKPEPNAAIKYVSPGIGVELEHLLILI